MNRIERISSILIHLQTKRVVKAKEIAERFEISLRTVYRDIRCLEEAGIPICSEPGYGYYLVKGYHLPPVMFSKEEVISLLIAEKMIDRFSDNNIKKEFKSAMYKIKSVIPKNEKNIIEDLDNNIMILKSSYSNQVNSEYFSVINQSIIENRILSLEYKSDTKKETTNRKIEPIGIYYSGSNWHIISYCLLRNDYRDFRLDRIKKIKVNQERFDRQSRKTLKECIGKFFRQSEMINIKLKVFKKTAKYMTTQKYHFGFVSELDLNDDWVIMNFLFPYEEYFARWAFSFTNSVKVISPLSLKNLMVKLTKEAYDNYLN